MADSGFAIIGIGYCHSGQVSASTLWAQILHAGREDNPTVSPTPDIPVNALIEDTISDAGLDGRIGDPSQTIGLFVSGDKPSVTRDVLEQYLPDFEVTCEAGSKEIVHLGAAMDSLRTESIDIALVVEYAPESGIGMAVVLTRWGCAERYKQRCYARVALDLSIELQAAASEGDSIPAGISYLLVSDPSNSSMTDEILDRIGSTITGRSTLLPVEFIPAGDESGALFSVIQCTLAISNKLIPANDHRWGQSRGLTLPLFESKHHRPWFHDTNTPRRAAILGGKQASTLILEEVPELGPLARQIELPFFWEAELAVFSASDPMALADQLSNTLLHIQRPDSGPLQARDLAITLLRNYDCDLPCRLAIVFTDVDGLCAHLSNTCSELHKTTPSLSSRGVYYRGLESGVLPKVACIFPGLGFPGLVGRYSDNLFELSLRFPEVRRAFDLVEIRGEGADDPYPTSHLFFPPSGYSAEQSNKLKMRLASPKYTEALTISIPDQKNLSSFGVAVANWSNWMLVQSMGIPVDMVFGQSLGELSALCAAGKIDFRSFIRLCWETDISPEFFSDTGRLALVSASADRLSPILGEYETISVAVHISPEFQILGGSESELKQCVEQLKAESIWTQALPYPAIHTPHFTDLRSSMVPALKEIPVYPASIPVYSGMTGELYPEDPDSVHTVMINNLNHPVHLWQTTRKMYKDGARVLLQAGGGASMYSHAKTNIGADDVVAVSVDVDFRGPIEQLSHMCAELTVAGVPLDLGKMYECRDARSLGWDISHPPAEVSPAKRKPGNNLPADSAKNEDPGAVAEGRKDVLPFSGEILNYVQDRTITINYRLDLDRDNYLADHTFVYAWDVKPLEECLPVLPMTVSLEIMAQAAAHLAHGFGLVGFEEISATNWIALRETKTNPLRIVAERIDSGVVGAARIGVRIYSGEREKPDIKGVVVLSGSYHESLTMTLPALEHPRPYPLSAEEIYAGRTLFHGPLFQCIAGETWLGEHGVQGELEVLDKRGMFNGTDSPLLLCDPLLLDAVGQLIGLWAMEKDQYVYPISMEKLEIYCPTPPAGTRVPVTIHISTAGLKTLYADIEIQDGSGHLWMRIRNWGDWAFNWPRAFSDYTRRPMESLLTRELDINVGESVASRIIDNTEISSDMLELLARTALSSSEMHKFSGMEENSRRQKHWLAGRVAAKDAVRKLLSAGEEFLHPAAIIIGAEESGRPIVEGVPGFRVPHISISHTDKYTVAIAAEHEVGIDIEAIQEREESFIHEITTPGERALLEDLDNTVSENITLLWSAKESAGKALGTGLPDNPQQIELAQLPGDGVLRLNHKPLDVMVDVNTWMSDNHYITVASRD